QRRTAPARCAGEEPNGADGEHENWNRQDLSQIDPSAPHHQSPNHDEVSGDVGREQVAEIQKAGQINHAGDDAEQRRKPPLESRRRRSIAYCQHLVLQALASVVLWATESITIFGTISPRLIPRMMRMAVELSANVAVMSSSDLLELSASCTRPLAILNRNTPGIMDTTEA